MYEHHTERLLSLRDFIMRLLRHGGLIGAVLDEKYGPKCLGIAAVGFLMGGSIFLAITSRAAARRQPAGR